MRWCAAAPAVGTGLDQAEHDPRHAQGRRHGTGEVEPALEAGGLGDDQPSEHPDDDPDGDVDEHDPAP